VVKILKNSYVEWVELKRKKQVRMVLKFYMFHVFTLYIYIYIFM